MRLKDNARFFPFLLRTGMSIHKWKEESQLMFNASCKVKSALFYRQRPCIFLFAGCILLLKKTNPETSLLNEGVINNHHVLSQQQYIFVSNKLGSFFVKHLIPKINDKSICLFQIKKKLKYNLVFRTYA